MKRNLLTLIVLIPLMLAGCNENKSASNNAVSENNKTTTNELNLHSSVGNASSAVEVEESVIEDAHKNYMNSYNEYVRCLRESGPQTVETLQALSQYQRNYQIYQMLLKAESKR